MNKKLIIFLIVLGVAQFIKPAINESIYDAKTDFLAIENPPEALQNQIKTSCYDCHSNTTKYPWYNKITPVNYWLNNHIEEAKDHLNFSDWSRYSVKKKIDILEECIEELEEKEMPLSSYTWLHKEASLSDSDRQALLAWLELVKIKYELTPPPM